MCTVRQSRSRPPLQSPHALDLAIAEAIRLQIGQAPIRVADIGLAARCVPIGGYRLVGPAERFERMAQHDPQMVTLRRLHEQFAKDRDRLLMAHEAREYRGTKETRLGI